MNIIDVFQSARLYRGRLIERKMAKNVIRQTNLTNSQVRYYNFWKGLDTDTYWMTKFLQTRTQLSKTNKNIAFLSVMGDRDLLKYARGDVRIFFTGENVRGRILDYADNMLNDPTVDLALGFDYFEDKRYMRFPLWLVYMLNGDDTDEQICKRIETLRYPDIGDRKRFCAMVASHDVDCIREDITKSISSIHEVSCGGRLLHNDDTLKVECNDNKQDYLQLFQFNICPENSNAYGYVTEKLFESISSGCIPIYWGGYNIPEPRIINKDAVIFFEPGKDNSKQLLLIEELYTHPKLLSEFQNQARFLPSAEDEILKMIHELSDRLNLLVNK